MDKVAFKSMNEGGADASPSDLSSAASVVANVSEKFGMLKLMPSLPSSM